jgi:plasmid stabilization system protein ParE
MSLPIRWSAEAENTFADIIAHLEINWSEKEIRKFIRETVKGCPETNSGISSNV